MSRGEFFITKGNCHEISALNLRKKTPIETSNKAAMESLTSGESVVIHLPILGKSKWVFGKCKIIFLDYGKSFW